MNAGYHEPNVLTSEEKSYHRRSRKPAKCSADIFVLMDLGNVSTGIILWEKRVHWLQEPIHHASVSSSLDFDFFQPGWSSRNWCYLWELVPRQHSFHFPPNSFYVCGHRWSGHYELPALRFCRGIYTMQQIKLNNIVFLRPPRLTESFSLNVNMGSKSAMET